MYNPTAIDQLMEFVVPVTESGCWLWIGETQEHSGQTFIDGKDAFADKAFWEAHNGAIPKGLGVYHSCHVRCCVNPKHLCLENTKD